MPNCMRILIIILITLFALSCRQNDKHKLSVSSSLDSTQSTDTIKFANFVDTVSYDLLCKSIDTVNKIFSHVRDTMFESEGVEWPGKIVSHDKNDWTVFETSWKDNKNISRVTTTSKSIKFQTPYQVGDSINKIKKDKYNFTFNEGDGAEYFYFTNERQKHLGFRVDEKYSNEFYKNVYEKGFTDPTKYLNDKATIIELTISGQCNN